MGAMAATTQTSPKQSEAKLLVVEDDANILELLSASLRFAGFDVSTATIADAQRRLGMMEGFDVGLEMSGQPSALPEMVANMNHGGRIALLGLPSRPISLDWARIVTHMLTIKGIYGREMYETWYAMSTMLQSGLDISPVITDRFPAADWRAAFATARAGLGGKVILDWTAI